MGVPEGPIEGVVLLSHDQARDLTERIKETLSVAHELIIAAYQGRVWEALGYASWDAYCASEFEGARMVRLPRDQRREIVSEMGAAGMSNVAVGSALGVTETTIRRDHAASTYVEAAGQKVTAMHTPSSTGTDGRIYPRRREESATVMTDMPQGPGRGRLGPKVVMTRHMETSDIKIGIFLNEFWQEHADQIRELPPHLLRDFLKDVKAARRSAHQLAALIEAATGDSE